MVKNTGVKVSEEHRQAALQRARGVVTAPVLMIHGKWLPDQERLDFGNWIDALAQSYGLPAPAKDSDADPICLSSEVFPRVQEMRKILASVPERIEEARRAGWRGCGLASRAAVLRRVETYPWHSQSVIGDLCHAANPPYEPAAATEAK